MTLTSLSLSPTTVVGGASSTGTVTLSAAAPSGGAVVTLSDDSAAATVPASVTVNAGATSRTFTVTTSAVSNTTTVSVSGSYGGVTRGAILTVNPLAAPTLQSPANTATGVAQPVAFNWTDVANALDYEIQVDNSSTIAAPFTASQIVKVSQASIGDLPAQQQWWRVRARNAAGVLGPFSATRRFTPVAGPATATLSTIAVSPASVVGGAASTRTVTLTASYAGVSRPATLTVNPPASLTSVALSPASLVGGASSTGTVTLSSAAPGGGLAVTLTSSNAAATVPASVTVAAGATNATFTAATTMVTAQTAVTITITASAAGVSRTANADCEPGSERHPARTVARQPR